MHKLCYNNYILNKKDHAMNMSQIYIRVVEADKDRGYVLLVGFDNKLVQSTCATYTTLGAISRQVLDAAIERMKAQYNAGVVKDVTAPALMRKLQKAFGEEEFEKLLKDIQ